MLRSFALSPGALSTNAHFPRVGIADIKTPNTGCPESYHLLDHILVNICGHYWLSAD